ncbi:sensor histidine kinase [Alkalihalobacillus trypoxylicola]|uniref:histidine kinase n=1 Tax=Alkalihalobacillus trypoxylicola TaxID=519424 RepID=A0A161PFB6_9BACI|nr:HAMP domain-containing sensor histidine kinase [Alkalihalobacillus trypoxylicola]KYG31807.1 hypothetical protein AZF04_03235 [Alkalihalobacillus trypoxylicola]
MNLSRKLTWFSTGLLLLLLIVVNIGIYFMFSYNSQQAELERGLNQAHIISKQISEQATVEEATQLFELSVVHDGVIRLIAEDGLPYLQTTLNLSLLRDLPSIYTINEQSESMIHKNERYGVARIPIIWADGSVLTLEYVERMNIHEQTMQMLRIVLIIATVAILIPTYFAGKALSRIIVTPIKNLTKTMESIRKSGTFKKITLQKEQGDELVQVGHTFNHMIELLEQNFKNQQRFISDASHELRTPLTVIESYAKLLKRWGKAKPEVLDESIEAIYSESLRMKSLTNQLLDSIKNQSYLDSHGEFTSSIEEVLSECIKNLKQAYQREFKWSGIKEGLLVQLNPLELKQIFYILFENAIKYSDGNIEVTTKREDQYVVISIKDQGIGIEPDHIPFIFERFYRVDEARSRDTGGSGLGLSIAKGLVEKYKGDILVKSEPGKFTIFTLKLPIGKGVIQ